MSFNTDEKKQTVLVVDDTPEVILLINEILKGKYRVRAVTNGEKALEAVRRSLPDIILMDVTMPEMNGYEVCRRLKQEERFRDIPVMFLTARSEQADEQEGLEAGGVDYIVKPINPSIFVARMETHLANKRYKDMLENQNQFLGEEVVKRTRDISLMQEATIMAMASLAETRDNDTGCHIQRTKLYMKELAEYMRRSDKYRDALTPEKIKVIVASAPLHDIGKVGIPDNILFKPGPLTKEEFETMKKHATMGRDAILRAEKMMGNADTFFSCAREIAYSHHEKWDGTGYPLGLCGEAIPLAARLMAVADVYDAITTKRVYKEAIAHKEAVRIIQADSGKHFDPDVVKAFLALKETFQKISIIYADSTEDLLAQTD
jgi:putative two-component system response regulator